MDGATFIDCASNWLVDASAAEPVLRSSVSRAYYGSFHRCGTFLRDVLFIQMEEGPSQHTKIPRALFFTGNKTLIAIGHQLETLKGSRHKADYKVARADAGTRMCATIALADAQEIRRSLDAFSAPSTQLTQMQAGIAKNFRLSLTGWSLIKTL